MMTSKDPNFKTLSRCLACDSSKLQGYLDLGMQPLANEFHSNHSPQICFPLAVHRCLECFHSQLTIAVTPDLLFRNYIYVSGTSHTMRSHFSEFVLKCENELSGHPLSVLDIASNDGSLLWEFKKRNHCVLGVDPATNLVPLAARKGIETINDYWSLNLARRLHQKFDVIVAMNVLAHNSNPYDFLLGCRHVLSDQGRIYIQTSQAEIFRNFEFDTIYHEHHSFFTAQSFQALAERCGLYITEIEKVAIHGTSYLATFSKSPLHKGSDLSMKKLIDQESKWGFYDEQNYYLFSSKVADIAKTTRQILNQYLQKGYRLIGYGAAAKANTFLNYSGINNLEFIIDDSPHKTGLFTPGTNIPVQPQKKLLEIKDPVLFLILSWNFFDEIRDRLKCVRNHDQDTLLTYFPTVRQRILLDHAPTNQLNL